MTSFDESLLRAAVIEHHTRALAALPSEETLRDTLTLSPAHLARMEDLRRRARRMAFAVRMKRAAAALLGAAAMLMLLCGVALASSGELRAAAAEWFAPVFRDSRAGWNVAFPEGGEPGGAALSFAPAWVPAGYTISYQSELSPLGDRFYSDGQGGSIYFSYSPSGTKNSYSIYKNEKTLERITYEGTEYDLLRSEDPEEPSYVFWTDQRYLFRLSAALDTETLLKIAASVKQED